ncbi:MAG: glycoside hydrolase family 26 protein [Prevotellaceae bacterium]|jgi:mannan endo-1,4-beta-mannosidase|nr:glycoside hydrolase family 26 protein [Prevotellaceae bacterium]
MFKNKLFFLIISLIFVSCQPPEITPDPSGTIPKLVTENPTPEVVALYNYLQEIYGQQTLSATVANVSWNTNEAQWVYARTGKYPAINVFDYIHLWASPANWIDYGDISVVEDWHKQGGIVGCMWHWNVPVGNGASSVTFRPEETTFKTENAVKSGTWENIAVKADFEKIASYLTLLKNKNIPVIWRPLHEAAGNIGKYPNGTAWFWWGNSGAEAYKNLWRYMYNVFQQKGLNNLIWVWTSETGDPDWYPGDEYVDIIGRDKYNEHNISILTNEFNKLSTAYPKKLISLSECGNVAQIPAQFNAGAHWLWFMPWYDYERTSDTSSAAFQQTDHQHGNVDFWNAAWNDERVLSRDEVEL